MKKSAGKQQNSKTKLIKKDEKKPVSTKKAPARISVKPGVPPLAFNKTTADPNGVFNRVFPYVLILLALFLVVCLAFVDVTGVIGKYIHIFLFGLFSYSSWAIPPILVILAIYWRKDTENGERAAKAIFGLLLCTFIAVLVHVFSVNATGQSMDRLTIPDYWYDGLSANGGGFVGGLFAFCLLKLIGKAGTYIVSFTLIFTFTVFLFGLTPRAIGVYIAYYFHQRKERNAQKRIEEEKKLRPYRPQTPSLPTPSESPETPPVIMENPVKPADKSDRIETLTEDDQISIDSSPAQTSSGQDAGDTKSDDEQPPLIHPFTDPENNAGTEKAVDNKYPDDLHQVFCEGYRPAPLADGDQNNSDAAGRVPDAASLEEMVERKRQSDEASEREEQLKEKEAEGNDKPDFVRKYIFPPISLLKIKNDQTNVDISEELHKNASRLVDVLASFRVRTRVVNVSRGPTVTRYELVPEEGVRVKSISSLVDDIALNLATTGVRIEAPIPGKSAVGVEVPNKDKETVFVRDLIDRPMFRQAPSKLNVALGKGVAGDPVYLDIAKMPHLLIAGATGMGKSVCINTIITSILYKATPDEVKLILIDPKKVEFGMYNGIPHLLVPVVSDPKKAAGSLQWAVTEMERRFELIEDVGARDLAGYSKLTENDPEREKLPFIVIIIDELADLMMTAPDDVEDSICRLAQKARAAGMHIVIGTQRPSVDVITGLIKANVPSRIAFTMASQVDSRTILDVAGAEKLIGRGDMLYAPVGFTKPMRVQGAFVSDGEVEAVVEFLRKSCGISEYDSDVIDKIEKEAAKCGMGKRSSDLDVSPDDETDPMLKPALELAVESGKISTSLIQRRLSLGYGRAAKLIDRMEQLGYVSPPDGQKPRTVLITRQQFMEMVLKNDEIE